MGNQPAASPGAGPARPTFHVVLCQPEIPNNTGNIGRTCVTTGCALHLIEPLGFDVSEKAVRRAGLDYWPRLDVRQHASVEAWEAWRGTAPIWAFSARAERCLFDVDLRPGDHLVFGRESTGLDEPLLERWADRLVALPMAPGERSLNLSTAVGVALFEGLRQLARRGALSWGPGPGNTPENRGVVLNWPEGRGVQDGDGPTARAGPVKPGG